MADQIKQVILLGISWAVLAAVTDLSLAADRGVWVGSWAMSPTGLPTMTKIGTLTIPTPSLVNGTVRYRIRLSTGGDQIRLRLSNEYGHAPLFVGAVSVGIAGRGLDALPGSLRSVSFAGKVKTTIPAGAPALSDPIDLAVRSLGDVLVSVYVPDGFSTVLWSNEGSNDGPGLTADRNTAFEEHFSAAQRIVMRPMVSAVDVLAEPASKVVAALGDSITDGAVDPTTGERGWPGVLSRRLQSRGVSVVNTGIGGNRLLQSLEFFGHSALVRLDRDVFSIPGLTHIVVLEGINDIRMSGSGGMLGDTPLITAEELVAAYGQIIARAHERGVKVLGATLLPFEAASYYSEEREQVRRKVNAWIRDSKAFDGTIDFDKAMGDPENSKKLKSEYDSGDHLHPNFTGFRKMGEVIDLGLIN